MSGEENDVEMIDGGNIFDNLLTPPRRTNEESTNSTPKFEVTESNEDSIQEYLSRTLDIYGLQSSETSLPISSCDDTDKLRILEIIYNLVKLRESDIEKIDSLNDQITSIRQDENHQRTLLEKKIKSEKSLKKKLGDRDLQIHRLEKNAKKLETSLKKEKSEFVKFEKNSNQKIKLLDTSKNRVERENHTFRERIDKLQKGNIPKKKSEFIINVKDTKSSIQKRGDLKNKKILKDEIRKKVEAEKKELEEEISLYRESVRRFVKQIYLLRTVVYRKKNHKEFTPEVKDNIGSETIDLPYSEYSEKFVSETVKDLVSEIEKVSNDFEEFGESDFIDQYHRISKILIECLSDNEEAYVEAKGILECFNERIYRQQDLLIQQNKILEVEVIENEKRALFNN